MSERKYKVKAIKSADMGFARKSLHEHIKELDDDGFELVSAINVKDEIVLVGKRGPTKSEED